LFWYPPMFWYPVPPWTFDAAPDGPFDRTAAPTPVDVWLIEVAYEVAANRSWCVRCGSPLGRGLRLVPLADSATGSWRVTVVTRCSGWRRHRYAAEVSRPSGDVMLGSLHPA
jgi:hypothetical protein